MTGRSKADRIATVTFDSGRGPYMYTTSGATLFEVAANAIDWWKSCKRFGTAVKLRDDQILTVDLVAGERYRVRVGRVRGWLVHEGMRLDPLITRWAIKGSLSDGGPPATVGVKVDTVR